ncbi:hypothetical protein D9M71_347150 [compost metagenome]
MQRFGQRHHGELGRRIRRHQWARQESPNRGRIDDAGSAALLQQARHEAADAVEHALDVHGEAALEARLRDLPGEAGGHDACVVEQQVDAAEALPGALCQAVDGGRIGDVGGHGEYLGVQRIAQCLEPLPVDIGKYQAHAHFGCPAREAGADAACRAGNDGCRAFSADVFAHDRGSSQWCAKWIERGRLA